MSFDEPALLTIMLSPSTKKPLRAAERGFISANAQLLAHGGKVVAQKHVALRKACPKCVFKVQYPPPRRRGI